MSDPFNKSFGVVITSKGGTVHKHIAREDDCVTLLNEWARYTGAGPDVHIIPVANGVFAVDFAETSAIYVEVPRDYRKDFIASLKV